MKKSTPIILFSLLLFTLLSGCEKFLDEKSDKRLSVPTTIEDFQAMINNYGVLNNDFIAAGEVSSDDYYISDSDFNGLYYESDKRLYTWQPDYVTRPISSAGDEWYNCYKPINLCNSILKGIDENYLTGTKANQIRGQALVFRAARYLDGVQIWSPVYNKETASEDLGMVLRLEPDMNIPSKRSSVQQTYDQIIEDLTNAIQLLPLESISNPTLPDYSIANGLLARTYLFMGNFDKALHYAKESLEYTNAEVIDFNTLDSSLDFPIPAINESSPELAFWSILYFAHPLNQAIAKINPELYNLYNDNDLRKVIYFKQNPDNTQSFKGTHVGAFGLINGLTPAELLLIIAECNVRSGNLAVAAETINQLLIKRIKSDYFVPVSFSDKDSALEMVLNERRKELLMRGLRWADIKRLNRDGYNITLTRIVNDQVYSLPPNDLRYAIALPETVVEIGNIAKNPR